MSFLRLLRCFNSPGSPRPSMDSTADTPTGVGFPIRISSDQRLLPSPRSFSQGATSFIASLYQGIHQMPLSRLRTANKSMRRDKPRQPDPITRVQFTQIGSREKTRYIMPSTTIAHWRPAGQNQRRKTNGTPSSKTRIIPTTGQKPIDGMPKTLFTLSKIQTMDARSASGRPPPEPTGGKP